MSTNVFRTLSAHDRALVAIAVLLDGNDAAAHLRSDGNNGEMLEKAAEEISRDELEMRLPFIGTLYREALANLRFGK
jgi:hypothetical protein